MKTSSFLSSLARPATGALALLLGALGVFASAAPAAACTVCYGTAENDSPLISGARLGVFLLLGITGVMLGAFARFFFLLQKRARQAENDQITSEWTQLQRSSTS